MVSLDYLEVTALTARLSFEALPNSEELLNIDGVQQVGDSRKEDTRSRPGRSIRTEARGQETIATRELDAPPIRRNGRRSLKITSSEIFVMTLSVEGGDLPGLPRLPSCLPHPE